MAGVKPWMAIYTKPRNEKKVAERLEKAGFEAYLPLQEQKRKWSDRYKTVKVPVISSYVFVRCGETDRNTLLQDPGILNFVFWLGQPAKISDDEISRLKFILNEAGSSYQLEISEFKPGSPVTIEQGKFSGKEGVVLRSGKNKLSVVLSELGVIISLNPLQVKADKRT